MSQVSRRVLDKELEDYIFNNFVKTIAKLKKPTENQNFLADLLSPIERTMLIKRLSIAVMLTKGYTYEQIDHTLKVSRPTIKNISLSLKYAQRGGWQKAVDEILKDQKREAFFNKIEEILLTFSPPKLYGSASYEQKKQLGKELFRRKSLRNTL